MRRIATFLILGSLMLPALAGCSLFRSQDTSLATDTYDPAYEETASTQSVSGGAADPYGDPYSGTYDDAASTTSHDDGAALGSAQIGQYHKVTKRETLYSLARTYYGDARRWKDIYDANRTEVSDPNKIFVGQRLRIP